MFLAGLLDRSCGVFHRVSHLEMPNVDLSMIGDVNFSHPREVLSDFSHVELL